MTREIDREIKDLCDLIAREQDQVRFRALCIRLHYVLGKKEKGLEEQAAQANSLPN
jgi:hypothetical protein